MARTMDLEQQVLSTLQWSQLLQLSRCDCNCPFATLSQCCVGADSVWISRFNSRTAAPSYKTLALSSA